MQNFMERNLNSLHVVATAGRFPLTHKLVLALFPFCISCLIPYLHIGMFSSLVWPGKPPVHENNCTCSCWDTIFRGSYEYPPGNYKHFYFNSTFTFYKIFCLIILYAVVVYEIFKFLLKLILLQKPRVSSGDPSDFSEVLTDNDGDSDDSHDSHDSDGSDDSDGFDDSDNESVQSSDPDFEPEVESDGEDDNSETAKPRWSMYIIFLSSIYPHYYGWWNYLNYYNEAFFSQWYHQLYFSITEIVSSVVVLILCNIDKPVETWHILAIFTINFSHISIGGLDQFVENLLMGVGRRFQVVRDLGLVIPDILAVLIIIYEATSLARNRKIKLYRLFYKEELFMCIIVIVILTTFIQAL